MTAGLTVRQRQGKVNGDAMLKRLRARFPPPEWPDFLECQLQDTELCIAGRLCDEVYWLQGHFPGEPILPGIAQLHWVIELGRELFAIERRFRGVSALKFQHIMQPGDPFVLHLQYAPDKHRLKFEYSREGGYYSQGRVEFCP